MKHIKTYKTFESSEYPEETIQEIIQYLKDIFQELVDVGYTIDIYDESYYRDKIVIRLNIIKKNFEDKPLYFKADEVHDTVISSIDYTKSIGMKSSVVDFNSNAINWDGSTNWIIMYFKN